MASIHPYKAKTKHPKSRSHTRYRVQWRDEQGTQRKKSGFAYKNEAELFISNLTVAMSNNTYVSPDAGIRRMGDYGEVWLNRQRHLKPSTMNLYTSTWMQHIKPRWETVPLKDIRHGDVADWIHGLRSQAFRGDQVGQPAGDSVKRRALSLMSQILRQAVHERLIASNPAEGVKLARKPPARKVYLTFEQMKALANNSAHPDIVMTLGTTGIRWGELAGLRVMDVDVNRNRLHIRQNAVRVRSKMHVGTPKSHEQRTVAAPGFVMDMISKQCEGKLSTDLVWSQQDGTPLKPPGHRRWLDVAVNRTVAQGVISSEQRVTAHGLRHVAAGLLVNANANVKTVQRQLGHQSAAITLDVYADLFDGALDEVSAAFDSMNDNFGSS